jgi:hypothetical protein
MPINTFVENPSVFLIPGDDLHRRPAEGAAVQYGVHAVLVLPEEGRALVRVYEYYLLLQESVQHRLAARGLDVHVGDLELQKGPCTEISVPLLRQYRVHPLRVDVRTRESHLRCVCQHPDSLLHVLGDAAPHLVHEPEMVQCAGVKRIRGIA